MLNFIKICESRLDVYHIIYIINVKAFSSIPLLHFFMKLSNSDVIHNNIYITNNPKSKNKCNNNTQYYFDIFTLA